MKISVAGVILAAGRGKRFGGKVRALLKINRQTFLEKIIRNFRRTKVNPIILVLGYKNKRIQKYLHKEGLLDLVKVVVNPEYQKEQILSLQLAIKKCPENFSGILFTPVDYPLVKLSTYQRLLKEWRKTPEKICLPSYRYRKGHPALFPRWAAEELLRKKISGGARAILKKYPDEIKYVIVKDSGILRDFDTISDWEEYLKSL